MDLHVSAAWSHALEKVSVGPPASPISFKISSTGQLK